MFFYGIGTPLKTVFLFSVFHLASHFSPAFVGEQKPPPQFPLSPPFSYLGLRVATVTDLRERSCWFEAAGGGLGPAGVPHVVPEPNARVEARKHFANIRRKIKMMIPLFRGETSQTSPVHTSYFIYIYVHPCPV